MSGFLLYIVSLVFLCIVIAVGILQICKGCNAGFDGKSFRQLIADEQKRNFK